MEIEKEYRYKVTDEQIQRIKQISNVIDEKSEQIDLTLGYDGFNSLNKYGRYILSKFIIFTLNIN